MFTLWTSNKTNFNALMQTFRSSFLAGICIGIAGFGYLAEKSIIGAVLFAFGLRLRGGRLVWWHAP